MEKILPMMMMMMNSINVCKLMLNNREDNQKRDKGLELL